MRGGAEFMHGGRGLRIATASVRTGFAMTLTISAAASPYKKPRRVCRPQATARVTPTESFSILRRAACPHAAAMARWVSGGGLWAARPTDSENFAKKGCPEGQPFYDLRNYSSMSITTPEPTVRPPSRIAKRRPFSIAMGVISSTFMSTLSPGMHISVPSGRVMTPVTSVVRK